MKKRLLALMLCTVMAFSICACGSGDSDGTEESNVENTEGATTVSDDVEKPYVVSLPSYDAELILTGDYEITEAAVLEYYYTVMYDADLALAEVTDRAIQDGDIVNVDYTGYLDGVAFSGGSATSQWIDVTNNCGVDTSDGSSSGSYIDGFTSGLIGAKTGETISYEVTFPETYGNSDLAGQVTTFEFVINGIYNELSPEELTDEYVATNMATSHEVSTVDELMAFCEDWVAYYYTMNYLMYNSVVEIPEEYLDARLDLYYDYLVEYYGSEDTLTTQVTSSGYTMDAAKASWLSEIESLVTEEIIFAAVAEKAGLEADEEWYNDYMSKFTTAYLSYWGSYYPSLDEATVESMLLKQYGLGDTVAGKNYFMNQKIVHEHIVEKYNAE